MYIPRSSAAIISMLILILGHAGCPPTDPDTTEDLLAPYAVATATPSEGAAPLTVTLDASASTDDCQIASYSWALDARDGLGTDLAGAVVQHTFAAEGGYTVTLTVTDAAGHTASTTTKIRVGDATPTAAASADPVAGPAPLSVQFTGAGSAPDGGALSYAWSFGDGGVSTAQSPLYVYPEGTPPGKYRAMLEVTDATGRLDEAYVDVIVTAFDVVAYAEATPAAGGQVFVDDPSSILDGSIVTVPPGAVSEPIVVTVSAVEEPLLGAMAMVELGPAGTAFSRPVSVYFPLPEALQSPESLRIVYRDAATRTWATWGISNAQYIAQPVPAVTFDTTHFTFFAVGDTWTVTELPTLGGVNAYAFAINDSGDVAGYSYLFVAANWRRAFLWNATDGMQDLGTLGGKHSYAYDLNGDGVVVGYDQLDEAPENYTAFIWDETSGMRDLGNLGGTSTAAHAINSSQQVAGYSTNGAGYARAFLWDTAHGMQDLGTTGGDYSFAYGINDAGEVVGSSQKQSGKKEFAFIWDATNGMQNLGAFPSGKYSAARAVNALSEVVGEAETSSGIYHAFIWDDSGGMEDLGTLGGTNSSARSINDSSQVVGWSEIASGDAHAFGWDSVAGMDVMTDLNDLLEPGSGWILKDAWDINATGDIVGVGVKDDGAKRGFLLRKE